MYLYSELLRLAKAEKPVRVGLLGAGKFGSMFLSQVPTTPGLVVSWITDLHPDNAKAACRITGWTVEQVDAVCFTDDAELMMRSGAVDVVVEATGDPVAGVHHAQMAISHGLHIVMVNVEADVLAGTELARRARSAGTVYSMAYGDQPALTVELVDWARSCGFEVVAAGKGTKYLPAYHHATPDTVWDYYGLTAQQAANAGMNSQMFNSFLDGTKSALEMAAVANATGLSCPNAGLRFPAVGMDDLAHILRPIVSGGMLDACGQVEVVSSLERDGRPVFKDLRWGVYVVLKAPNDYAAACFRQYGMNTDSTGQYSAMYKPFHLIGLELNISVLSAALLGQSTGATQQFKGDVVATAKTALKAGQLLDGEGGYTVWGKLYPAVRSVAEDALPIGLAHNVQLKKEIPAGQVISWSDVKINKNDPAVQLRLVQQKTLR